MNNIVTTPEVFEIKLILEAPDSCQQYKLKSTADGLTLLFEMNKDENGGIGSGNLLGIVCQNNEAMKEYLEKIKSDPRTISIENWEESNS